MAKMTSEAVQAANHKARMQVYFTSLTKEVRAVVEAAFAVAADISEHWESAPDSSTGWPTGEWMTTEELATALKRACDDLTKTVQAR